MENLNSNDHDLLIEMRTEMRNVRSDIKELKDGTTQRIQSLENDKANRIDLEELQKTVNEHIEIRVRKLESKTDNYFLTITLYSLAVIGMIGLIVYHILQTTH